MNQYSYSVIVPYRDKYDLFVKAIESIPDRDDIQIIIVDNAPQPIKEDMVPVKRDATIVYANSSPVKGAGCARNEGLRHVEGRYILFLDADDFFTVEAFDAFDKYIGSEYDIVYFRADSVSLVYGSRSERHKNIDYLVKTYDKTGNEDFLRYRFINPVAKMLRSEFVKDNGFQFDEIPVSNDVWFSVMTGHSAKLITADKSVVYMITTGESGSSLTKKLTKENWFTRFQVCVKVNKFLKSIGKYNYRIRLLGGLRVAWRKFGFREFMRFLKYAFESHVGIF